MGRYQYKQIQNEQIQIYDDQIKIMFCLQCFGGSSRSSSSDQSIKKITSPHKLPHYFQHSQVSSHHNQCDYSRISLKKKNQYHRRNHNIIKQQETWDNYFLKTEETQNMKTSTSQPILKYNHNSTAIFQPQISTVKNQERYQMARPPFFKRKITFETQAKPLLSPTMPNIKINFVQNSIKQSKQTFNSKCMLSTIPSYINNGNQNEVYHIRTDTQMNDPSLVSSTSIKGNNHEFSISSDRQLSKSQGFNSNENFINYLNPYPTCKQGKLSCKSVIIHNLDQIALTQTVSDGSSNKSSEFSEVIAGSVDLMRDYELKNSENLLSDSQPLIYQRKKLKIPHHRKDSLSEQ